MMPPSTSSDGPRGERRSFASWQGWQRGQRDDLTFQEAAHVLWERRAVVVGCTLFFLAVALLYGLSREPVYQAEATLAVRLEEGIGAAERFEEILLGLQDSEADPGAERELLFEEVAERAGWQGSQRDFNERLGWEQVSDEEVVVRFSAPTPEAAAGGANAYTEVVVERLGELRGRLAGGTVAVDADVAKAAEPPEGWYGLTTFVVAAAAVGGGLLVGGIAALFLEGRASRWRGSRDAELTLRAPVLGVIPFYPDEVPSREGVG